MMSHQIFHMISHKGVKTNTHDHNPLVYIQILIKKTNTKQKCWNQTTGDEGVAMMLVSSFLFDNTMYKSMIDSTISQWVHQSSSLIVA